MPGLQITSVDGSFDEDAAIDKSIRHKMSKSIGKGALWINDSPEDIKEKYREAYCPEKIVIDNPVLDHARMLVFPYFKQLDIERPKKYGGDITFYNFRELGEAFERGELHPLDLKNGVSNAVIKLLKPVADYFEKKPENLERMKELTITR